MVVASFVLEDRRWVGVGRLQYTYQGIDLSPGLHVKDETLCSLVGYLDHDS